MDGNDDNVVQQRVAKLLAADDDGGPEQATAKCNKMLAAMRERESGLDGAARALKANYDGTTRDWTGNNANG